LSVSSFARRVRLPLLAAALIGCGRPAIEPPPFPAGAAMTVRWGEAVDGVPFTLCEGFEALGALDPCVEAAAWHVRVDDELRRGVLGLSTPFLLVAHLEYELELAGDVGRLCRTFSDSDVRGDACPEADVRCGIGGEVRVGADGIAIHAELPGGATLDALIPRAGPDAGG
jgi:hypothetical protein